LFIFSSALCPPRLKMPTRNPVSPRFKVGIILLNRPRSRSRRFFGGFRSDARWQRRVNQIGCYRQPADFQEIATA
jgi:hypothetical protein